MDAEARKAIALEGIEAELVKIRKLLEKRVEALENED